MCGRLGIFWVEFSYKSTKLKVGHGTLLLEVGQKSTMLKVAAKVQQKNDMGKILTKKNSTLI